MARNQEDRHTTDGRVFFLQGHAGTGKTYLMSLLREMVEAEGLFVKICVTTGLAASLYRGGRTLHSLLGISVEEKDASEEHSKISKYSPESLRGKLIQSLALLIIDEASMMQRILFEHFDTILKNLRCPPHLHNTRAGDLPYFGGLVVVCSVDYIQLLPVVPSRRTVALPDGGIRVIPVNLLDKLPWYSALWNNVKVLWITQQIRQAADTNFSSLLMNTAKGLLPEDTPLPLRSTAKLKTAYKFLWRWMTTGDKRDVDLDRMLVCPTNSLVDEHNDRALELFPGRLLKFRSSTTIEPIRRNQSPAQSQPQGQSQGQQQPNIAVDEDGSIKPITPELTYNYTPTGVPPHLLKLKIRAPLMVIRNVLHPKLVKGALFVLRYFKRHVLCVITVPKEEREEPQTHLLHRIDFLFDFKDFNVTRRQFPIPIAFSSTVHKAQGQTLLRLLLDLRSPFFSPGQLYVAPSRTRKSQDVLLLDKEEESLPEQEDIHEMPVPVRNPILQRAVHFATGDDSFL